MAEEESVQRFIQQVTNNYGSPDYSGDTENSPPQLAANGGSVVILNNHMTNMTQNVYNNVDGSHLGMKRINNQVKQLESPIKMKRQKYYSEQLVDNSASWEV